MTIKQVVDYYQSWVYLVEYLVKFEVVRDIYYDTCKPYLNIVLFYRAVQLCYRCQGAANVNPKLILFTHIKHTIFILSRS